MRPFHMEIILTLHDPNEHARVGRVLNPAFSGRAAQEQESWLIRNADQMLWRIGENAKSGASSTAILEDMFTFTTFDTITDLSFGESLHLLGRGEYVLG
jgi:cytochrome P450